MHIAPFVFTVKNAHTEIDFGGYIRYQNSRRNRNRIQVAICTGADMERIGDFEAKSTKHNSEYGSFEIHDHQYHKMFYTWLLDNGLLEEYFAEFWVPEGAFDEKTFRGFLAANGATLRFW